MQLALVSSRRMRTANLGMGDMHDTAYNDDVDVDNDGTGGVAVSLLLVTLLVTACTRKKNKNINKYEHMIASYHNTIIMTG